MAKKSVKITDAMLARELERTDWRALESMSDEEIRRQIAENPDAAPDLSDPRVRLAFRLRSRHLPTSYRVRLLRRALKMTRAEFADAYGIPERTLQAWEQGAREPDQAALSYLAVIAELPDQIRRARAAALRKSA